MPLFEYRCPNCGQISLLDPVGSCTNTFNDRTVCGYRFPLQSGNANSKVTKKMEKHTTPQTGVLNSDYSWVDDTGKYPVYQLDVAKSGSVHLDTERNYLFLWKAPEGATSIGKLIYAQDCHFKAVSGVVMPLNSKLQNTHIHFNNYENHFVEIAPESNEIVIQEPSLSHPDEYWVLSGAKPIFSWNQVTQLSGIPSDSNYYP